VVSVQAKHICRLDSGPLERLLAVGRRRSTHVSLHVGEAGAAGAGAHMATSRADRQILGANGADVIQFWRVVPDLEKLLPPDVAAGQRKLHAGEDVAVGRDIGQGVTRAAGISFHHVFVRNRRRGAKLFDVSHQAFVVKNVIQFRARNAQIQNRGVGHPFSA
jgi:hypothetical protein